MPNPEIVRRVGGWFVANEGPRGWSGPWRTQRAAKLARDGDYDAAHLEEKKR